MPSKSPAQARLMAAIAHGWRPSGMKNPPSQKVAKEFNEADTGTKRLSKAMKRKKKPVVKMAMGGALAAAMKSAIARARHGGNGGEEMTIMSPDFQRAAGFQRQMPSTPPPMTQGEIMARYISPPRGRAGQPMGGAPDVSLGVPGPGGNGDLAASRTFLPGARPSLAPQGGFSIPKPSDIPGRAPMGGLAAARGLLGRGRMAGRRLAQPVPMMAGGGKVARMEKILSLLGPKQRSIYDSTSGYSDMGVEWLMDQILKDIKEGDQFPPINTVREYEFIRDEMAKRGLRAPQD